jgi:endonuclease YncB( thermonuclease family)
MPLDLPPPIIGIASVIDGDTIEIHGNRIRLNGIDAPESRQLCKNASGADYRCGQQSALYLANLTRNKTVNCVPTGRDRYMRILARCNVGPIDLQAHMVQSGHALAFVRYSRQYVAQERIAESARAGIWQGAFEMPWDWRKSRTNKN